MNLEAQWVVGFVDGEGCFHIGISKNLGLSTGIQILPEFVVTQQKDSVQVLHALKAFFKTGVVRNTRSRSSSNIMCYRVRNRKDLQEKVIPFFEKHQLKTKKNIQFKKFRKILLCMENNEHLTMEGINKIRSIRDQEDY